MNMLSCVAGATLLLSATAHAATPIVTTTATAEPSWQKAAAEVAQRAAATPTAGQRAKNIILFIGDGMGISTITAGRIYAAQRRAKAAGGSTPGFEGGEESLLSFEELPARALVKTYNSNAQVPDSAGTATAFTTGTKTRIGVLGIRPGQGPETCRTPAAFPKTLGEVAREEKLGLGIVTTTRITHATPAAVYAHAPSRGWEAHDKDFPREAVDNGCTDIASQLVAFKGGVDVALGGGLAMFVPAEEKGARTDGRNLLNEWRRAWPEGRLVTGASGLRALDPARGGPVLGLFNASHLDYNLDADRTREPSLAEMAVFAVRKLAAGKKGYVLMIEGGRIDHGHHMSNAARALDETAEFSDAIAAVLKIIDLKDTLVLVTADHSHSFTMTGYPPRGNDILGYLRPLKDGEGTARTDDRGNLVDQAGRAMPTLSYANGPLETKSGGQQLSAALSPADKNYLQPKTFILPSENHGGEDVALFGAGPGSALASGTIEQNSIFHIIARAMGWQMR